MSAYTASTCMMIYRRAQLNKHLPLDKDLLMNELDSIVSLLTKLKGTTKSEDGLRLCGRLSSFFSGRTYYGACRPGGANDSGSTRAQPPISFDPILRRKPIMKEVDASLEVNAWDCSHPLGQALSALVNIVDSISDAHPITTISWTVLSATYKNLQDADVRDLAESLCEICAANDCLDLREIEGTAI
ncbi:hypothetical protein BJ138DRAFT_1104001 [Hygrophoropsis aurantiaca]|uniref:Uncharacterized protein n=1 Tax=Hygrophoropsis aurantiaca TaxID=72124 RepID=A0ACB8A421_9AGAM|nr:hypothetical protein BJ138DRAFT_1104001 [Hygrophoropsis aurantiaca]